MSPSGDTRFHVRLVAELERSYQRDLARGAGEFAAGEAGWALHGLMEPAGGPCDGVLSFVAPWGWRAGLPGDVPIVFTSEAAGESQPAAVVPDNHAVGRLAADHLIARGGRRFALVAGDRPFAHRRRAGFVERLAEGGFELDQIGRAHV